MLLLKKATEAKKDSKDIFQHHDQGADAVVLRVSAAHAPSDASSTRKVKADVVEHA